MAARSPKITDGAAVAHHKPLESPFVTKNLPKQPVAATARLSLKTLICTHNFLYASLLHKRLEGRQISLPQITWRQVFDVKMMARLLRTAMHGKMLCAGIKLHILMSGRSLQATHHGKSHARVHIRVLTISFLPASPSRITENVYVWSPERKALITAHAALLSLCRILCTCLIAHRRIYTLEQHIVERRSHSDT